MFLIVYVQILPGGRQPGAGHRNAVGELPGHGPDGQPDGGVAYPGGWVLARWSLQDLFILLKVNQLL